MKYVNLIFSVLLAYLCYLMVSLHIPYQLYQWEHTSLFMEGTEGLFHALKQLGGLSDWVARYGIQFFAFWGIGSWVFILPVLVLLFVMAFLLPIKEIYALPIASCTALALLLSMYDYHYSWSGAISLSLALIILIPVVLCKSYWVKMGVFLIGLVGTFWCFGAVANVYLLVGICLLINVRNWKTTLCIPISIMGLMVVGIYQQGLIGSFNQLLTPLFYYDSTNHFPLYHWLPWVTLILTFVVVRSLCSLSIRRKIWKWGIFFGCWLVPSLCFIFYSPAFVYAPIQILYRLNHYSYTENWDSILRLFPGNQLDNWLYMNYINMALAHKGQLADKAFMYKPQGRAALMVNPASDGLIRMLKSDVNYTVGCISEAQHQAFDAQIAYHQSVGIQTLKRLVQTNLIFGYYEVAEKYLNIIGKTTFYKEWANYYCQFLYNDEGISKHPELGEKRKSLIQNNRFALVDGWTSDLEDIVRMNPQNRNAMEYLGIAYLLGKEMDNFRLLLKQYYGTDSLASLPVAFQQAVVFLYHNEEEKWNDYHISKEVADEYKRFVEWNEKYKDKPNFKHYMETEFGHTFWFYSMFV